jgi:hypothetical protein
MWVEINQATGSNFQPILSHFPTGGVANALADFNLQVWPNGQICFFMGNGAGTNGGYGILLFGSTPAQQLASQTWYHIAVVSSGTQAFPYTPDSVTVYVNGQVLGTKAWNEPNQDPSNPGQRQLPSNRPNIGRFDNTDPNMQFLAGAIDELRFWDFAKTQVEILDGMNFVSDSNAEGLLAYYQFENTGLVLVDNTGSYNGAVQTSAGGEQTATYIPSGAPVDTVEETTNTAAPLVITLSAISDISASITYYISQLPTSGTLFLVSKSGTIGLPITLSNIASALPSNQVAYAAQSGFTGTDSFQYQSKDNVLSSTAATVVIEVSQGSGSSPSGPTGGCDGAGGVYDACGVCNGDGLSCTCVADQYRSYSLSELDRILVHYNIEYTLDLINALNSTLDQTLSALYSPSNQAVDVGSAVDVIQTFNTHCLGDFIDDMDDFLNKLKAATN